jgi:hypothetical protein
MTEEDTNYADLTGDPVYDYIESELLLGGEMIGAQIEEPIVCAVGAPRKIIHVVIYDSEIDQSVKYSLNYNKLYKEIKNGNRGTESS